MRLGLAAGILLTFALSARVSVARSLARLELVRGEEARTCPSEPELRASVAERLGYDPFRSDAAASVRIVFWRAGSLKAQVTSYDADHRVLGVRELEGTRSDCRDLADAVTLTVSIVLDQPTGAPSAASPPSTTTAAPPEKAAPPERAPTSTPWHVRLGAEALGEAGSLPSPALGVSLFAGARKGSWSADLEAHASVPVETEYADGTARSAIRTLAIAPCRHQGPFSLCAVARFGVIAVDGVDVLHPKDLVAFYAAGGARVGFETPIAGPILLRLHLDGLATATRTTISVGDRLDWSAPPFSASLGLGFFSRFP